MGEVINFQSVLHRRRVDTAIEASEAREQERLAQRRATLHEEYGSAGRSGALFADIVADVIEAKEREEKAAEAPRFVPAYCDPDNDRRGSKYENTRNLSTKDIAARIRGDIKEALARGVLPAGLKVSVRYRSFSGGSAIDLRVTAFPEGFTLHNPAYLRHEHETRNQGWQPFPGDRDSTEWAAVRAALKSIHGAYNRDNSDSMTDYFDVRYYGDVDVYWEISRGIRERELAAALQTVEG